MDCVLLGYAFHSVGYRTLIIKSEVSDLHVGTIMESNDATFFEDIFPMKDMSSSSNQEIPTPSSEEFVVIPEPTVAIEHVENPIEGDNGTPLRSKRQRTAKSFGDDSLCTLWMTHPGLFQKPMHLLMPTTTRKVFVARWIPS